MPDYGDRVVVPGRLRQVVVPEAELFLPDDKPINMAEIIVRSAWFGGKYPSVAAVIKARTKAEFKLNGNIEDWQRDIVPPCFVQYGFRDAITDSRVLVYGAVPSIATFVEDEAEFAGRVQGKDRDKFGRRLRTRLEHALRRGWLYGQWYSVMQPKGEWSAQHKSVIQRVLTEQEFNALKEKQWA
jgi:hypothetical protein